MAMTSKTNLARGVAMIGLATALAACSNKETATAPPTGTTPTPPASFQSQFGATFAGYFNNPSTIEPIDPAAGDVPPLNATAQPVEG
jgi:hypothetical protein